MRYHVIRSSSDGTWQEYALPASHYNEDPAKYKSSCLNSPHLYRIEDMKTRQVVFSTFRLQDETRFIFNRSKLKNYQKAIHYWNRRLHPSPKDKLSLLLRKEKAWQRRLTIAKNKLKALHRAIKYQKNKTSCPSLNTDKNPTSRSAATSSATTCS